MPITITTGITSSDYEDTPNYGTAASMANAIASSSGSTVNELSGSTTSNYTSWIPMDSIGYPGWCTAIVMDESAIGLKICRLNGAQNPDFDDPNTIGYSYTISSSLISANPQKWQPETCVMIYDENKDTVLFDVHPGRTAQGTDLGDDRCDYISFTFFFAKDVNGGVLCGLGVGHITAIRTESASIASELTGFGDTQPTKRGNPGNVLHLTKMMNYLSSGYPEMKSAYVSVLRPFEENSDRRFVSLINTNGKNWGRAGLIDSWNVNSTNKKPMRCCFQPIEPFVNY